MLWRLVYENKFKSGFKLSPFCRLIKGLEGLIMPDKECDTLDLDDLMKNL